jgi:hypothetical protein
LGSSGTSGSFAMLGAIRIIALGKSAKKKAAG